MTTIREAQNKVTAWLVDVFPDRTQAGTFVKFFSEIGEMTNSPKDAHEYADVLILLVDLAEQNGVDLESAFEEKMLINMGREWKHNTELGIMSHIKEGPHG